MHIDILTLFPDMFKGPFDESIIRRAQDKNLVEIEIHNLREWAKDRHKTVDDHPYGGGVGMVLRVDVVERAISSFQPASPSLGGLPVSSKKRRKTILLDPGGKPFTQKKAQELSTIDHLILIAAHYEGVDHRIREHLVDEEISIGDYVLTGGELPAMVVIDAVTRLIPGVIEKPEATQFESFSELETGNWKLATSLEYPQYTRPEDFHGWKVPKVLLSGNHKEIEKWRAEKAQDRTKKNRPDLL